MNDQSPDYDRFSMADGTRGSVSRRTVIAGSALAVPAIVLTAGAPAFAASGLILAFDRSTYSGPGCSTITGAKVFAQDGGVPKPGTSITVSLSSGYTFSTGGTTFTATTGSDGSVALPGVNVPAVGGTGTASASSAGATTVSAALSGTATTSGAVLNGYDLSTTAASGVPHNSVPISGGLFLASDGRVIDGSNSGIVLTTNVDSAGPNFSNNSAGRWSMPLKKKNGTFTIYWHDRTETTAMGIPAGSTPVTGGYFLAPDGRMIDGSQANGALVSSNIDKYGAIYSANNDGRWSMPVVKRDGSCRILTGTQGELNAVGVPSGSRPISGGLFLSADGRLIDGGNGGILLATGIDSAGTIFSNNNAGHWTMPLKKTDGTFAYLKDNLPVTAAHGVPSGSTPVTGGVFLSPNGDLIDGGDGNGRVITSGVKAYGKIYSAFNDGRWSMPLNVTASSC